MGNTLQGLYAEKVPGPERSIKAAVGLLGECIACKVNQPFALCHAHHGQAPRILQLESSDFWGRTLY